MQARTPRYGIARMLLASFVCAARYFDSCSVQYVALQLQQLHGWGSKPYAPLSCARVHVLLHCNMPLRCNMGGQWGDGG